jgi:hypothetical protein
VLSLGCLKIILEGCSYNQTFSVRCSSSPLVMSPLMATVRSILSNSEALLGFVSRPTYQSSPAGKESKPPLPPRRLQTPAFQAACAQFIISIAFSLVVAYTSLLPFTHNGVHGDTPMKTAIITVACVTNLANLYQTCLNGTSHEINPLSYRVKNEWKQTIILLSRLCLHTIWFPCIVILVVSYFGATDWKDFCVLLSCAMVLTIHAILFDFLLKSSCCSTPRDIRKSVEELSGDGSKEMFLDVVLLSLCHSNKRLAKTLSNVSTTAIWLDIEKEEKKRNESAMSAMATLLLYKTPMDESGPHLEEDLLRLAIVSSINTWVGDSGADEWKKLEEPYFVPICRCLCAYFGGLGEALIQIASNKNSLNRGQWLMAPGCVVIAEYSIRGATHCLLSAISSNSTTWRNSHLATLVPALLSSLFRLETGLVEFVQIFDKMRHTTNTENEKTNLFRTQYPQYLPLFLVVIRCSRYFLQTISQETTRSEILSFCSSDIQRWCDAHLDSIENPL